MPHRPVPKSAAAPVEHLPFGVFPRRSSIPGTEFPRGLPTRGAKPVEQVPLAEALARRWDDDRHVVLYTSSIPYRINNAAVEKVEVAVRLLAFDVDNHNETPGWMEGERAKIAALLDAHPGGFAYTTRRGWRVFYALPDPFPIRSEADKHRFVLLYARVASYVFERFGVAIDAALIRWNQPVRLPHVVRDGRVFDAEILGGDPEALGAFELPDDVPSMPILVDLARVVPTWGGVAKQWAPTRERIRVVASAAWDHIPLPPLAERLAAASVWVREDAPRAVQGQGGRATAKSVAAMLHVGFALERPDVERLLVGTYNRRRCSPPWSESESDDLRRIAQEVARTPIHPPGFLLSRDRTGVEAARATLVAAAAAATVVQLEDAPARMIAAVNAHRAVVLRATAGAGKTHTLSRYIATETRGRVIVVVPRHELGRAWVEALAAAGETDVAYHASVVQRFDEMGRRHCDQKKALEVYARGGDVRSNVCSSCPRVATCPAFAERPNMRARVHVLPREMLAKVGVTDADLVVLDDAATDLVMWHRLTVRQLHRLAVADERLLPAVQRRFVSAFVDALVAGPRRGDALAREALGGGDLPLAAGAALRLLAARAAEGQRSPYIASDVLAEGGLELAATLLDVGTLRDVLRFAIACADGGEVHWSGAERSVHGESLVAKLVRSHQGRLVVLDAAANVEELRALRTDLHVERLDVADRGDAARILLFTPNAHRTALADAEERGALLGTWLDAALAKLSARGAKRVVFVTYKKHVAELRAHPALAAWLAAHPRRKVRVVNYGAVRGSNRFRRVQAVVTLGDPWLNGNDVLGRAEWLALNDEPAYRIALAAAELGQAHGRSRSVRRRRRLTHVHVGRLVPEGWGAGAVVEPLGGPPERTRDQGDRVEFGALVGSLGGDRVAAKALGCSHGAVVGWKSGRRGLPRLMLERLRVIVTSTINASASSGEPGGGGSRAMEAVLCKQRSRGRFHESGSPGEVHVNACPSEEAVLSRPAAGSSLDAPETFDPLLHDALLNEGDDDAAVRPPHRESHRADDSAVGGQPAGRDEVSPPQGGEARGGEANEAPRVPRGERGSSGAAVGAMSPTGPSSLPARADPRVPGDVAAFAAQVLATLEAIEPSPPPRPAARASPFDDIELEALREAQARARRRLGLDP